MYGMEVPLRCCLPWSRSAKAKASQSRCEWNATPSGWGDCWDNSPTERFFRSLKSERLSDYVFTSRKAAKSEVVDYIAYYNGIRLHSTLGYQPPVTYEKELYRNAA